MEDYVKDKTKEQLVKELSGTADPGSPTHEQMKMGIIMRCTQDLEKSLKSLETSMNLNADSSQNLARKVFWLNWILVIATVIIAIAAIVKE